MTNVLVLSLISIIWIPLSNNDNSTTVQWHLLYCRARLGSKQNRTTEWRLELLFEVVQDNLVFWVSRLFQQQHVPCFFELFLRASWQLAVAGHRKAAVFWTVSGHDVLTERKNYKDCKVAGASSESSQCKEEASSPVKRTGLPSGCGNNSFLQRTWRSGCVLSFCLLVMAKNGMSLSESRVERSTYKKKKTKMQRLENNRRVNSTVYQEKAGALSQE